MAGSLFYFSCGDPSERPGREAGEEHNNTTGGSGVGTTAGSDFGISEDTVGTTAGSGASTTGGFMENEENTDQMEESTDTSGNFHPRQKGGSTPADERGNY